MKAINAYFTIQTDQRKVWSVMTQKYGVLNARTRRGAPGKPRKEWSLFFLVLPWLILTIVFCYLPIAGWSYAFIDFRLGRPVLQSQFVGLDNFKLMFSSISRLPRALRNTLVPNGINLALSWMPIAFAVCLNELRSSRYRKCVQTITTIPNFISWVMIYGLTIALFSTDGAVNIWLKKLGLSNRQYSVLNDINVAWTFQAAMNMWKTLGYSAIIYLAAISGIDQSLYDAAMTDGAGLFQRIWHVTLPGVLPTYTVQLVLTISSFVSAGMDYPLIFGSPITTPKLENISLYSYNLFKNADYSYGIALGMMNSLVSILLLVFANAVAKKVRGSSIV